MNRLARSIVIASALALAGCSSMPDFSSDPSDWFNVDFLNNKKPLPGVRKPVFPDGVPGVTRGVPQDLVKGYQPPPDNTGLAQGETKGETPDETHDAANGAAVKQAAAEEEQAKPRPKPRAKAKPKPKPKVAARPVRTEPESDHAPTAVTVSGSTASSAQSSNTQWPEPPAPRQQQSSGVQWPDPPGAQGSASGGVQWPDPPAPH